MSRIYKRKNCRLCEGTNVDSVLKMVPTPIGDAYLTDGKHQETYAVELFLCKDCGHAQLLDVLNPESIYTDYIYKTSDSLGLVEHFNQAVDSILSKVDVKEGSLVVDIGSNDGSFLNFFKMGGMNVLGVEPAKRISQLAIQKGIETKNAFFSLDTAKELINTHGKAKIVTSNNTFANIDDLNSFVEGIKEILGTDGVFIFETGYVLDLLQKNIFDNIYHEHLSYFSVKPLQTFFEKQGMKLVHVERIKTKGGSIRCFVQYPSGPLNKSESVEELIEIETNLKIQEPAPFKELESRIRKMGYNLRNLLTTLKKQGKKIAGYGASVGVTTVLYNFGLDKNLIDFLVDDNLTRQGLLSPGLEIPVKSSQELHNQQIDYVVVLAWQYANPIISKNNDYLTNNGKFINFLPSFEIVSREKIEGIEELPEVQPMKKVVVIGSNSFSGSHFIKLLLEKTEYSVIGISRSPEKKDIYLPYKNVNLDRFKFHQLDLNGNLPEILELFDQHKPDYIVNFASQSMVGQSWDHPEHWYQTNVISTVKLTNWLKDQKWLKKYVHISTPEVYGSMDGSVKEDHPFNPSTPYAGSRAAADEFINMLIKQFDFPAVFTRAANVYGPGQQLFKIIPRSIIYIKKGQKIPLHGGGEARRSFIHITDVCEATLKIMENANPGEVFHLSTKDLISIKDLVRKIAGRMEKDFDDVSDVVETRKGLDSAYILDSEKAEKELNWFARIDINEGINETTRWVNENWDLISNEPLEYIHQK